MKIYIVLLKGDTGAPYVERGWNGYKDALEIIPCATKEKAEQIAKKIKQSLPKRERLAWKLHHQADKLWDTKYSPMLRKLTLADDDSQIYGNYNKECEEKIYSQWQPVWEEIEIIEKEMQ